MLAEHVERARARRGRILGAFTRGVDGGAALQDLEAIGRNEDGAGGLVQPMIGAPDALGETARALRRAHIDDEIDIAPVDAKIKRRGADDRFQPARRHGRLDLATLTGVERAMMQGDRQAILVAPPQLLKDIFSLRPRVDEDEGQFRGLDRSVDFAERMPRAVSGPGQKLPGVENAKIGRGPVRRCDEGGERVGGPLRRQPATQFIGIAYCRGKARRSQGGRDGAQPREPKAEQIAAFCAGDGVQFIEDDAPERGEQMFGVGAGEQKRQLLRGRQQDIRRRPALALTLGGGGIARARLNADPKPHFGDGYRKIAFDVDGERFQRRNVKCVQTSPVGRPLEIDEGRQESSQRFARAGGCDQQRVLRGLRRAAAPSDAVAASSPARRTRREIAAAAQNPNQSNEAPG